MQLNTKHPLILLSKEFAELCRPLESLQIHHFTYLQQMNDGGRIALSNKPSWTADYYNLNLNESSAFEAPPSQQKANYELWIGDYDLEVYRHGRLYYQTCDSISITEPNKLGCEHFLFAAHADNKWIMPYLFNNMEILYHFIAYLRDQGQSLLQKSKKTRIQIQNNSSIIDRPTPMLDKANLLNLKNIQKNMIAETPINRIYLQNEYLDNFKLSKKELSCLADLCNNLTAKETAKKMQISYRTVESYISNIKLKFACNSRRELLNKLKENPYLSSLFIDR